MTLTTDPNVFFIDGFAFGWRSCLMSVDGIARRGFRGIDWEETIEREKVHSMIRSGKPLLITYGEYEVKSLSAKMLPQEKQWLRAYLATKNGNNAAGSPSFTMQLQLSENGYVVTTTFSQVRLKSGKGSFKPGAEGAESDVDFDCMSVKERDLNGTTTLYDDLRDQEGGPGF